MKRKLASRRSARLPPFIISNEEWPQQDLSPDKVDVCETDI